MLERNLSSTERIIRAAAGAILVGLGLRPFASGRGRLGLGRALLALVGGVLGFTAITGHCAIYSALGISTARE